MSATACSPVNKTRSSAGPQPTFTLREKQIPKDHQEVKNANQTINSQLNYLENILTLYWTNTPGLGYLGTTENKMNWINMAVVVTNREGWSLQTCKTINFDEDTALTFEISSSWFARWARQWTQLYVLWQWGRYAWNVFTMMAKKAKCDFSQNVY